MKITRKWLVKKKACDSAIRTWDFKGLKSIEAVKLLKTLVAKGNLNWANWLIVRVMSRADRIRYACFAARQVLHIFEKKYPGDKRPRTTIETAEKCIENNSKKNRVAANAAANESYAANAASYAASYASYAAHEAAYAAANESDTTTYASYEAANAAAYAAYTANDAAKAAYTAMKIKILRHGIELLNKER